MHNEKFINIPLNKIILITIIGVVAMLLSEIPYIRLFATTPSLFFVIWLTVVYLLNCNSKIMLISFFSVLFYSLILILIGHENDAEIWGDWSFLVLLFALGKNLFEYKYD